MPQKELCGVKHPWWPGVRCDKDAGHPGDTHKGKLLPRYPWASITWTTEPKPR